MSKNNHNTLIEIVALVTKIFDNDLSKISTWMNTGNLNFGGFSPTQLIERNRGHKVLEFIRDAIEQGTPVDSYVPEKAKVIPKLEKEDVEWVVNDLAELGVKIGNQFFFMYKGRSYKGGYRWRHVYKREFGEVCKPWDFLRTYYNTTMSPDDYSKLDGPGAEIEWRPLPEEHGDE